MIAYRGLIIRGAFSLVRMEIAMVCSVLYCSVCPVILFVGVLTLAAALKHTETLLVHPK